VQVAEIAVVKMESAAKKAAKNPRNVLLIVRRHVVRSKTQFDSCGQI